MTRYAIFGDSYVRRLGESEFHVLQLPGDPAVMYYGKGGLTLEEVRRSVQWRALLSFQPTDVFFHCGGNSINSFTTPAAIFHAIVSLADDLDFANILIGEILPRGRVRRETGLTVQQYDDFCREVNGLLAEKYGRRCVKFYLKTAYKPDGTLTQFHSKDRIHLSEPIGMLKYRKIIRRAFLHWKVNEKKKKKKKKKPKNCPKWFEECLYIGIEFS